MALTVTEIFAGANGGSASTTYTVVVGSSCAVGDLVVVLAAADTSGAFTTTAITDTKGNTWNRSTAGSGSGGTIQNGSTTRACFYWSVLTTGLVGGVDTIRLTTSGSSHKTLQIWKVTGGTTISQDVATNSDNQATTTTPVTGTTAATAQANEIAWSAFLYANAPTFTPPAGWTQTATTQLTANGGACTASGCYKILAATGTQNANSPTLGTTETAGGMIFTLKYTAASSAPVNTVAPAVTGNKWVGQQLSTTNGTWTGDTSSGFTYQWKDAGGNIAGATASTYTTTTGEIAASIHCSVTATGTGGSTAQDSNTTGPIGALYSPTMNAAKIDVCANSITPTFTPGASGTRAGIAVSISPSIASSIAPSIGGR